MGGNHNKIKLIRETTKAFCVALWYILKKKGRSGEHRNTNSPRRAWKTKAVDDRRIVFLAKKTLNAAV